jgi:uncharacterized protein (DUF2062 family)
MKRLFTVKKDRKRGIHKTKRDFQLHIAEWIYPSIGLKAWWKYLMLSLKRKPLSSHKIALGFAFGAFASFTPYMGFHGLISVILAKLFKASLAAALIGTIVGNPWTFPFIWAWSAELGNFILHEKMIQHKPINFDHLSLDTVMNNFEMYWDNYIYPMTIGGVPTGILAALAFYFIIKYQIDKYRQVRAALLHKRRVELRAKKIQAIKDKILPTKQVKKESK